MWWWILASCATAYGIKLAGYLVPRRLLERPAVVGIAGALTVGLLAALAITNTVVSGQTIAWDSRLLALAAAGVALWRKAPFILVVIIGAAAAALGRLAGLP